MSSSSIALKTAAVAIIFSVGVAHAAPEPAEIYCTIRSTGLNLSCQQNGKKDSRKVMAAEDISNFVDQGQVAAYVILKSRKGYERVFLIDGASPQYKRLDEIKASASISEISKAKSELFGEIEKRLIRISDDLDNQAQAAELVKYDSSIAADKFKRDTRKLNVDLEDARKNHEKFCASTPIYEKMLKTNTALQTVLSNVLSSFQTPETCMSDVKVTKDGDGFVDLKQFDNIAQKYVAQCKR